MRWLRDNLDLVAVLTVVLAATAETPVGRIRLHAAGAEARVTAEIEQVLDDATGEIRRTLRTTRALHRYNDWTRCRWR